MKIFIDESGTFAPAAAGSSVGAVGALVVTENQMADLEQRYARLRPLLPKESGEVKGRLLREADIARVVDIALRSGALYEVTTVDLAPNSSAVIEEHRGGQCDGLTTNLTDEHHPRYRDAVWNLRRRLEQMPLQLYVQSVATFDLLWRTLKHSTLYHSQRDPTALSRFDWIIDAKSPAGITDWEDWWKEVVQPMLQSHSFIEPFHTFEFGDYSHFAAREIVIEDYYVNALPHLKGRTALSLRPLLRNIAFTPDALPGIEIVDFLTNAVRRALSGRLGPRGWRGIANVMVHREGKTYIRAMGLGAKNRVVPKEAARVLAELGRGGRSMIKGKQYRQ